jgi:hypothetical protein
MKTLPKPTLYTLLLVLALAAVLVSACGPQAQAAPSAVLDYTRLVEQLRAAGHTVEELGELEDGVFGAARLIRVNGEDVQIYPFASQADQEAAARTISANGHIIGTNSYMWISQPYFYAAGQLVALYLGVDGAAIELLAAQLGRPLTGAEGVQLRQP